MNNNIPDRTVAPAIHNLRHLVMPGVESRRLSNGMRLITYNGCDEPVSRLVVAVRGGHAEGSVAGFATLLSRTCDEGTSLYSASQIAETLDFNGSWMASNAEAHLITRTFFSLNDRLDNVLPVIAESVASPVFPDHEISVAREKFARTQELNSKKVAWVASQRLQTMTTGSLTPLTQTPEPAAIRTIEAAELRDVYRRWFNPADITLYLCGQLTGDVVGRVEDVFGRMKATGPGATLVETPFIPQGDPRLERITMPGELQSAIAAAIPAIGRNHPDYVALRLAVTFLGGYFGSRLMMNLREDKGFTYGVSAALEGYRDAGRVTISLQCDNAFVEPAIDEIRNELKRMADPASYSDAEIQCASSFVRTVLASQLDSPFSIMDYHQLKDFVGTPENYFESQQEILRKANPEWLASLAARYLDPDRLYITVAGA